MNPNAGLDGMGADPRVPARTWPQEVRQRVDRFLFEAPRWVQPAALLSQPGLAPSASVSGMPGGSFVQGQEWSERQLQILVGRLAPIKDIEPRRLMGHWSTRLCLLDASEWMRLGFALSVLPFCGQAQRSMDGHFRRALREHLGPEAPELLDALAGQGPPLKFLLGPGAWRQPQQVACGGLRSAWEQLCDWGRPVRTRFSLGFDPQVWRYPASVEGLNEQSLEIACKLIWQEHPWLWS